MPVMDGVRLTQVMHNSKPGLRVILDTGSQEMQSEQTKNGQFAAVVAKPFTAENVAEGIALFTANHQHIDAVLTDYDFPNGMTGLDLVTHIQMRQPGFPCVVMSAHWTETKRPKDEAQANLFYRAKPFAMAAMLELLVEACGNWERPAVSEQPV